MMLATHSGIPGKVANIASEQMANFTSEWVANFDWNRRPTCPGIGTPAAQSDFIGNSVTFEAIRVGFHVVRNPMIFPHFPRLRPATHAGLGIPHMMRIVREHGRTKPEIIPSPAELRVLFRFIP
jgi:hypothetical protein